MKIKAFNYKFFINKIIKNKSFLFACFFITILNTKAIFTMEDYNQEYEKNVKKPKKLTKNNNYNQDECKPKTNKQKKYAKNLSHKNSRSDLKVAIAGEIAGRQLVVEDELTELNRDKTLEKEKFELAELAELDKTCISYEKNSYELSIDEKTNKKSENLKQEPSCANTFVEITPKLNSTLNSTIDEKCDNDNFFAEEDGDSE